MDLFKSKRFWSAVVGLGFMIAVHFLPQLQADEVTLTQAALIIVSVLVGGFTIEQSVQAHAAGKAGKTLAEFAARPK